ncbi:MAG: hypothetical protein EBT48_06440 [Verrucomicrobia bacterium]|nr:hypothetical protein [Verrucomicrobiota bacterium]
MRFFANFLYLALVAFITSLNAHALETGNDLKLDPDRYLGKKVSLIGRIDSDYQPLKVANGSGSFYVMDTGKNVRENYGNVTRSVFANEGQVVVFVPTAKISSFVSTFKQRVENNSNTAGKGFSGIYLKKEETEEFKEWRGWWYWYNYHKGYYVDLTGN